MRILQLAGTSDARELALAIKQLGFDVLTTVVTANAANELKKVGLNVLIGRLTATGMTHIIEKEAISIIVDSSHPFAEEATRNAIAAAKMTNVPYIRFERPTQRFSHDLITEVNTYEEAASLAAKRRGSIMLTTGSKTLQIFTEKLLNLPDTRVIARMLPRKDNFEKCEQLGLQQKDIIAMQGPFSQELNVALFKQFATTLVITKESGKAGAVDEKIAAAIELGIETIVIKRPTINYGTAFSSINEVTTYLSSVI